MRRAFAAAVLAVGLGCGGPVGEGSAASGVAEDGLSAGVSQQLAAVRKATARYHDVQRALADGYVPASPCEHSADGTMGVHYVKFPIVDLSLSIEEPEVLLYVPSPGGLRLVAVEYLQPILTATGPYFGCGVEDESCPPPNPPPAPTLFEGVPFDGPMAGHNPQMPWHFDQHVWLWAHNRSGMFARYNPGLSCPAPTP